MREEGAPAFGEMPRAAPPGGVGSYYPCPPRLDTMGGMNEQDLRRLVLNLNVSLLLAPHCTNGVPSQRDINRAVQTSREIDKAVRKRIRWEARGGNGKDNQTSQKPT